MESVINISVLQGTTLGPILFLCYINDIFTATSLATFLFADDTSCLAEHNDLNTLINYVNCELQKLSNWFDSNKMAVNISKTKYIIFRTKGKKILNPPKILFNTNELNTPEDPRLIFELERVFSTHPNPIHREYKLLGVYFDEYLNFDKHVKTVCAKLTRANYCIRRVSNKLPLKSLKCLYYAIFHPHLLYCINIYSCTSNSNIKKITTLQKKAIRIINKAKANSHTDELFKLSEILPFHKIILQAKLHFMHSVCYNYSPSSFNDSFKKRDVNPNYNLRNRAIFAIPTVRIELFKKISIIHISHNLEPIW